MQLSNHGSIAAILLLAGMLAFFLGFALLAVYKRTIARHMQRAIASGKGGDQDNCSRRTPPSPLTFNVEHLGRRTHDAPHPAPVSSDPTLLCATIYAAAGLMFGIVATCLLFVVSGIDFLPLADTWSYDGFGEQAGYAASFGASPLYSMSGVARDKAGQITAIGIEAGKKLAWDHKVNSFHSGRKARRQGSFRHWG